MRIRTCAYVYARATYEFKLYYLCISHIPWPSTVRHVVIFWPEGLTVFFLTAHESRYIPQPGVEVFASGLVCDDVKLLPEIQNNKFNLLFCFILMAKKTLHLLLIRNRFPTSIWNGDGQAFICIDPGTFALFRIHCYGSGLRSFVEKLRIEWNFYLSNVCSQYRKASCDTILRKTV